MSVGLVRGAGLAACVFAMLLPSDAVPVSGAQSRTVTPSAALKALDALAGGTVRAHRAPELGAYDFIRADRGRWLAPAAAGRDPEARALRFLAAHGRALGLNRRERALARASAAGSRAGRAGGGSRLRVKAVERDELGFRHVRFRQVYRGLRVFGGELIVHLSKGGVTAVNGVFVPGIDLGVRPRVTATGARRAALAAVRGHRPGIPVKATRPRLEIFRTGLLERYEGQNRLAYRLEVRGDGVRDEIWVDARSAAVLLRAPRILSSHASGPNRCVYSPTYDPSNEDLFVQRREGGDPSPLPPVNTLYDFAGHTYNLFASAFDRHSYDDAGAKMISVYSNTGTTPCPNATWNGTATNFCAGYDTDDIVAHEWGHAYTQHTHDLVYAFQPGALNESYSDIWGEVIDLHNGVDGIGGPENTVPFPDGQRWLLGEDAPDGPLRDMWDPERLGQPAKVTSNSYACADATNDGGGVHTNSGVPNHAFAMLVDGKEFNGLKVNGIGVVKAAHVYFRAQRAYQTRSSNFAQHAEALEASCQDLIGAPLHALQTDTRLPSASGEVITADDCEQVAIATAAVELRKAPPCRFPPLLAKDPPPVCAGASAIYTEDFESGLDGWKLASTGVHEEWPGYHWEPAASLPGGRAGSAAFAIDERAGTCATGGDISGTFSMDSPAIAIPSGAERPQLRFDHFVETEAGYDGGNLAVSVNGGDFELVPSDAYVYNGPSTALLGRLPPDGNTNPKAGELAWHGTDGGQVTGSWGTTVVALSTLASPGDTVRLRFDFGIDGCNGITGWFVDDLRIYDCPRLEAPALAADNPDGDGTYVLRWTRPDGAAGPDVLQESTTPRPLLDEGAEGGAPFDGWDRTGTSITAWGTSTAKPNHSGTTFWARSAEGVTSETATLTTNAPVSLPAHGRAVLSFAEWYVSEGDDRGVVEIRPEDGDWVQVHAVQRAELAPDAALMFESEPLTQRTVDLGAYLGRRVHLRFRYAVGPENRAGSTPMGWYVDDIRITADTWRDLATVGGTAFAVAGRPRGSYGYRVRSTYELPAGPTASPYSEPVVVDVDEGTEGHPNLRVSGMTVTERQGAGKRQRKTTVTATIANTGAADAPASRAAFVLDGGTPLGVADVPALPAGSSAQVAVTWTPVDGEHAIRAQADDGNGVEEIREDDNQGTLHVTVRRGRVKRSTFIGSG